MSGDPLLDLIRAGRELLARERAFLVTGDYPAAERLAAEKLSFVERFGQAGPAPPAGPAIRKAVEALIRDARLNERLIAGAREGFAAARRRIAALEATRKGAVAYAPDGSAIRSRLDACGPTKSA